MKYTVIHKAKVDSSGCMGGKGGVDNSTCINNNSSDSSPGGQHCHLHNKMEIESKIQGTEQSCMSKILNDVIIKGKKCKQTVIENF